jgi:hypothetical protein
VVVPPAGGVVGSVVAGGVASGATGVVAVLGQKIQARRITMITTMMMYQVLRSTGFLLPAGSAA